jgi:hypothetical protein
MRQQGLGDVNTAYQRWKKEGQPRPYANEVIAVERFDFFAMASLVLAVALLGWWIYSIWRVAFPEQGRVPVVYSRQGGVPSVVGSVPAQTPPPTPTPPQPLHWGGARAGGTLPGGTRTGGTRLGALLVGVGAVLAATGFAMGYWLYVRSRVVAARTTTGQTPTMGAK